MMPHLTGILHDSGRELATQLLRADSNQRIEILELCGSTAPDLRGVFEELHAQSRRTKCLKYFYSLSIISDTAQGGISRTRIFRLNRAHRGKARTSQPAPRGSPSCPQRRQWALVHCLVPHRNAQKQGCQFLPRQAKATQGRPGIRSRLWHYAATWYATRPSPGRAGGKALTRRTTIR